jgi:hypothetical protein
VRKLAEDNIEYKVCTDCEKRLATKNNFYNTNSPLSKDGKMDLCKKCLSKMIDINDINTVYKVLQLMDIPFYFDYWEKAKIKTPKNPWGSYIRQANSGINEFKNATYNNSVFKPNSEEEIDTNMNEETKNKRETGISILKDKFGYGYPEDEYFLFEKKYQDLRPSFQLLTTMHEECLREYCINKVKEGLAKAKGNFKEAKEWASMAKDVANSGKLNPSQMSKADLSGGLDTFGQLAKMVGETDRGEILKILPMFAEAPKDKVDITMWHYINYVRDLKGMEECQYKDIYEFYNRRAKEYESGTLDEQISSVMDDKNE